MMAHIFRSMWRRRFAANYAPSISDSGKVDRPVAAVMDEVQAVFADAAPRDARLSGELQLDCRLWCKAQWTQRRVD
jgi:hypothetical protein